MDARRVGTAGMAAVLFFVSAITVQAGGGRSQSARSVVSQPQPTHESAESHQTANYRTQNFLVSAPTAQLAREIGDAAENFRRDLAIEWLGRELPPWPSPGPITAEVSPKRGAGGATTFFRENGRPYGTHWTMSIFGSRERVLDSVLPHEVMHTIFATHFGRPLPRWCDEGACTTVEHTSERAKQERLLIEFLTTGQGIAFNQMFAMSEYPANVLPLYSQGYSLSRFLIALGGKPKFVAYVGDGMAKNNWTEATKTHYGFKNLSELQLTWVEWVRQGSREAEAIAMQPRRFDSPNDLARAATNSSATPVSVTTVAATKNTNGGGWYAKERDRVRLAAFPNDAPESKNLSRSTTLAGNRSLSTPDDSRTVTRPLPPERPREIILEWSRAPGSGAPPQVVGEQLEPRNAVRETGTLLR